MSPKNQMAAPGSNTRSLLRGTCVAKHRQAHICGGRDSSRPTSSPSSFPTPHLPLLRSHPTRRPKTRVRSRLPDFRRLRTGRTSTTPPSCWRPSGDAGRRLLIRSDIASYLAIGYSLTPLVTLVVVPLGIERTRLVLAAGPLPCCHWFTLCCRALILFWACGAVSHDRALARSCGRGAAVGVRGEVRSG